MARWIVMGLVLAGYGWALAHTPTGLHGPLTVVLLIALGWAALRYGTGGWSRMGELACAGCHQRRGLLGFRAPRGDGYHSELRVGIHEAGHLAGIEDGGLHTGGAKVIDDRNGVTTVSHGLLTGRRGSKAEALAILAGSVAEYLWLHHYYGIPLDKAKQMAAPGSQHDFSLLQAWAFIRHRGQKAIDPALQAKAEDLVMRYAARIEVTGEEMARYGKVRKLLNV